MKMFTSKEIKAKGWLERQLKIQAEGLSGHLDKIWPDIKDSAWIGGEKEGWERVPYWLDGFIPLAYLLDDKDKISRAKRYIDSIIKNQKADGWICPCKDEERATYDIWALFLICKVLVVYYDCSGDDRIEQVVYDALKNGYDLLRNETLRLKRWAEFRWFECFISINWLYERRKEAWIKDLAKILKEQGTDYGELFAEWELPMNKWRLETHIVNLAMALKSEAVTAEIFDGEYTDFAEKMYTQLKKYNGTVVGLFTGDECLAGVSPIQGTELCAVVEQMYSYEILLAATKQGKWADRLEKLAFNALPATISEDMWTHQYVQMANQISCEKFEGKPIFRTVGQDAHNFGLEPHFGCCTANFNQGWPKFTLASFMKTEEGIVSAVTVPSSLETEINGVKVSVELITDYPFGNELTYKIKTEKAVEFDFDIHIPEWSVGTVVNGKKIKKTEFYKISKVWNGSETVKVSFKAKPCLISRPSRMKSVIYGPFVMSLPIGGEWTKKEYTKDGVERKFPYCDYNIAPVSKWNYGFADKDLKVKKNAVSDIPFSEKNPPIQIEATMQEIDWGFEEGYDTVCRKIPKSRKPIGKAKKIMLQPYGSTKLRLTEMPMINEYFNKE